MTHRNAAPLAATIDLHLSGVIWPVNDTNQRLWQRLEALQRVSTLSNHMFRVLSPNNPKGHVDPISIQVGVLLGLIDLRGFHL